MTVKAHFRGHQAYYDEVAQVWRYLDDGTAVPSDPSQERPCFHCHLPPTPAGHDGCLGHIPGAHSACCGHGVHTGYIVWDGADEEAERSLAAPALFATAVAVLAGWLLGRWRR